MQDGTGIIDDVRYYDYAIEAETAYKLAQLAGYEPNPVLKNKWLDEKPSYPEIYGYKTPQRSKF